MGFTPYLDGDTSLAIFLSAAGVFMFFLLGVHDDIRNLIGKVHAAAVRRAASKTELDEE